MKNHVLRPLWLVLAALSLLLLVRYLMVPDDFGIHGESYTYGFHRKSNVEEWKEFKVKHQGIPYCSGCHSEQAAPHAESMHAAIQCESCHGPAIDHPADPQRLTIDTSRELCLRCHAGLPTPGSGRAAIPAVDPQLHNPNLACALCHAPHKPDLEKPQ